MDSRERREKELQSLLTTNSGREELKRIYRAACGIPQGQAIGDAPLVSAILSKEFGGGENTGKQTGG